MNVLVVEDEGPKRDFILAMLQEEWPDAHIDIAKSVRAAVHYLKTSNPDIVLLDMSLPTFDVGSEEPGGRPQGIGGIEVIRYLERYGATSAVIVVTAYEAVSMEGKAVPLEELRKALSKEHPDCYRGVVYFNRFSGDWRASLSQLIKSCLKAGPLD